MVKTHCIIIHAVISHCFRPYVLHECRNKWLQNNYQQDFVLTLKPPTKQGWTSFVCYRFQEGTT